ncbi:thylakoid lumenal 16.5 kDa protein, chloroplastic [Oryza glaberrima]|uniref:Maintenance of Photosystem II under High light 2 C-terminal domain-containing protein n=1 Tax=Oryza glaberrima TaxID=4538 RepID=I1Q526_ORYGL|nr:thylakoid lumenal 16.5 kDa protein, chloroplastic [Oryza glaberrima]
MVVAIATEAWALAGCGAAAKSAAAQEAPVQLQQHSVCAAKAKKPISFRGVAAAAAAVSSQCHQERRAVVVGRRSGLASCLLAAVAASFSGAGAGAARAAVLEADDDIELLERVKEDRKKRLQKQGVISSSGTETGYLQDLIYKLSKVGQAIDKNDLPAASSVLGPNSDAQWVQNINVAFTKFSSSPEEKNMVDSFNSSLASLITSVNKSDVDSSKSAFVSSATTLEKWIASAGLSGQLKGF